MSERLKDVGNVLFSNKKYAEALEQYSTALLIDPTLKASHLNSGLCCRKLHDLNEAMKHFTLALRLDPRYEKAYQNLGRCYLDVENLPEGGVLEKVRVLGKHNEFLQSLVD